MPNTYEYHDCHATKIQHLATKLHERSYGILTHASKGTKSCAKYSDVLVPEATWCREPDDVTKHNVHSELCLSKAIYQKRTIRTSALRRVTELAKSTVWV